ncbi:cytochrome c oxidase accessory protein CcoG [Marinobacterium arenosum]|uniref:cytochrome c oxidase accessory protein CcoG n=1 Tax=Marinobacterium arenosum TaxID=2862496 RepID=UPI001C939CF9|nr:cytochrome c oxidase accessory protein CcoG [Marinobacterium arenosum]MBY4676268.1 cytochrome c oxidase accessory protein CcoG [Marinobacterium arenosum]
MQQIPLRTLSTTTAVGGKIHVRLTEGRFQNLRRLISGPLLLIYFALVWVQVDGRSWLLFDFEARRILLFGLDLAWHDLPLLAGLMIAGSTLLFFAAVGWGRVWCGFACPQSIWTWLFIRIETLTEGRAALRRKQEKQPLTGTRVLRRIAKHALWLLAAFVTAFTFTGYFVPARELSQQLLALQPDIATVGWLVTMTALTYLNAGLAREKVCTHMCPYSRFQGVMFDADTRTVTYDAARGEPRRTTGSSNGDAGDCVNCDLCVQVCPTGIDIRDGLQYECIDCGACIDACDKVMEKIGKPKGLIAFKSENQLQNKPSKLLRPRLLGYFSVLLITTGAVAFGFSQRSALVLEVLRDRGAIVQHNSRGEICNSYQLKLEAVDPSLSSVELSLRGPQGLYLNGPATLWLGDQGSHSQGYQLCSRNDSLPPRVDITFVAQAGDVRVEKASTFLQLAR